MPDVEGWKATRQMKCEYKFAVLKLWFVYTLHAISQEHLGVGGYVKVSEFLLYYKQIKTSYSKNERSQI